MENNIIPILESTVVEATSKCDIPWIWKLNKIHNDPARKPHPFMGGEELL